MVLIKGKAYLILIKCTDASLDYCVVISIVMKTRSEANSTPFTIYKKKKKKKIFTKQSDRTTDIRAHTECVRYD